MKVLLLVLVAGLMPVFAFAYDGSGYPAYLGSGTKCHTDGDWMECTQQGVVQTAVGSYLRQNATGTVSPVTWIASLTDGFDFGFGLLRDGYR